MDGSFPEEISETAQDFSFKFCQNVRYHMKLRTWYFEFDSSTFEKVTGFLRSYLFEMGKNLMFFIFRPILTGFFSLESFRKINYSVST